MTVKNTVLDIKVYLYPNNTISYKLEENNSTVDSCYDLSVCQIFDNREETVVLEDISRNRDEAIDMLYLFARETVTAETAHIIMEELLCKIQ